MHISYYMGQSINLPALLMFSSQRMCLLSVEVRKCHDLIFVKMKFCYNEIKPQINLGNQLKNNF